MFTEWGREEVGYSDAPHIEILIYLQEGTRWFGKCWYYHEQLKVHTVFKHYMININVKYMFIVGGQSGHMGHTYECS